MNWMLGCAALMVLAAWLAFPEPHTGLRRIRPQAQAQGGPSRLLAGRPGAPPLRQRAWLGVAAAVLVLVADPGPTALVLAPAIAVGMVWGIGQFWPAPKPDPRLGQQLPVTLDLLAACLQAGAPMARAVETVSAVSAEPTASVLERVAGQLRLGRAEADAWLALADDPAWGVVARDVARSARSGTSLVDGLLVHAEDQRRRTEAERTKAARAVGVRSVLPLMVCFLPAFILVGVVPIIAGLLGNFLG